MPLMLKTFTRDAKRLRTKCLIVAGMVLVVWIANASLRRSISQANGAEFEPERLHAEFMAIPQAGPMPEVPLPEAFTRMQQPLPNGGWFTEMDPEGRYRVIICDIGAEEQTRRAMHMILSEMNRWTVAAAW